MGIAVLAQVLVVECGDGSGEPLLRQVGDRHGHRMKLPDITEVGGAFDRDRIALDALPGQPRHYPILHVVEQRSHFPQVNLVLAAHPGPREVVEGIDEDEADGARHSGERRNDHLRHLELERQIDGM